jgi:hypothetical protein
VGIYDLTRFRAWATLDVLRTRPRIILGGVAREHPFCVRPAGFLKELEERTHA